MSSQHANIRVPNNTSSTSSKADILEKDSKHALSSPTTTTTTSKMTTAMEIVGGGSDPATKSTSTDASPTESVGDRAMDLGEEGKAKGSSPSTEWTNDLVQEGKTTSQNTDLQSTLDAMDIGSEVDTAACAGDDAMDLVEEGKTAVRSAQSTTRDDAADIGGQVDTAGSAQQQGTSGDDVEDLDREVFFSFIY